MYRTAARDRYNVGMKKIIVKAGREKSLLRRHPWIFSGALKTSNDALSGDVVAVHAEDGRFLAQALFSEQSQIVARAISFDETDVIDDAFFEKRIAAAIARRAPLAGHSNAMRLVHAESDGLPGLIADRYGEVVVLQLLTAGIEPRREFLASVFLAQTGCATVYERSDAEVRALEGLAVRNGLIAGAALSGEVVIKEGGLKIAVDVINGHKTGFYLDQRDNRRCIGELARGREALNCFCYTGGFTLSALAGGARTVLSIDSSSSALELARRNLAQNGLDPGRAEWLEADVFRALRRLREQGRQFDLIVLDPPKFAPTPKDAERAARGYKDINLNALKLLRPGGLLATFSCSGGVSPELFQKIVAGAAADAGASLVLRQRFCAAPDHPVLIEFPEGEYLKGLLLERC